MLYLTTWRQPFKEAVFAIYTCCTALVFIFKGRCFQMANIKIHQEILRFHPLRYMIWLGCFLLLFSMQINAEEIEQRGDAYVIYLSGDLDFDEVVDSVKNEVLEENWQVVNELDIGTVVKDFGKQTDNRVISVCKSQYLARAIDEDPFISLIIPCRFTIFREKERIVVGFYDPVAEANGLNLKQAQAAEKATQELKAILLRIVDTYQ